MFVLNGAIEDSATAEISRSQVRETSAATAEISRSQVRETSALLIFL